MEPFRIVPLASPPGLLGLCRRPTPEADSAIAAFAPHAALTLLPEEEMAELGLSGLKARLESAGAAWLHLPIPDYGVPAEAEWDALSPGLHALLDRGERLLIHCRAGLGRTGMIAARLLAERGAAAPVGAVRAARPGAVETAAQEAFARAGIRR